MLKKRVSKRKSFVASVWTGMRACCGHSMDRATITRHLLSDETDPFSRARCTVDMLVDNEPLKSEIANWKAQRKAEAAAARAAGAAPMEEG